jgi:prolyl-tRNA synthetase
MPETKVKKDEDFNEWYNEIVELADLCDKRYPIKGMNVWRPYGWKLMSHIDTLIRKKMDGTNHQEVCFPLCIPESLFQKEADHIKGFSSEVYWVTHAGHNVLEERWLLRPTSETAMYPVFSLWIRSHADLPLKIYQIVNTFRYETKQTRAFIRVREIHFFEAHTCHVDFIDAERQVQEDKAIADSLLKQLCLPYIFNKRPEWDKFAGAFYTISIDVLMPSNRTLQLGSIHQYKDNFSKPYEISYETEDGGHQYCHQTTYGMSERLLGAVIGIHADNKGLVLPPAVAPNQIIIVPIVFKGKEDMVLQTCETVAEILTNNHLRVVVDKRDITPGNKFYEWELKGVPMRIEIGPRDVQNNQVVVVPRDTGVKLIIPLAEIEVQVTKALENISNRLFERAQTILKENTHIVTSIEEAKNLKGIVHLPWCGKDECALEIENILEGNTLGEPLESDDAIRQHVCPVCHSPAINWIRFARSY